MSQHKLVENFERLVRNRYLKDTVRVTLDSSSVTKKMVKITLTDDFVGMGFGIERELLEAMTSEGTFDDVEEQEEEEEEEQEEEDTPKKSTKKKSLKRR
jgi:hypothetical protein